MLEKLAELSLPESVMGWLRTPGEPYQSDYEEEKFHERDDIWHEEEILSGERFLIESATEWYESPNVVTVYTDHKYLFNQNMGMGKPFEKFYFQNADSNSFESEMEISEELPSGRGELIFVTNVSTKSPPSGDNNFAMMDYSTELYVKYDLPDGISFLPRFIALPLNGIFKYYFIRHIGEEMLEYDIEYARERVIEYFDYIRKYHGEEPVQTRSRRAEYTPPWEGTFFD